MGFGRNQKSKYYTTLKSRAFNVPSVEARRDYYETIYDKDIRGRWIISDIPSCFCPPD
jgi:hypothetical protein